MTSEHPESTPVLVVGGSLVGLSAAVFLAWRGVPVVLVERHQGSSKHPRAIGYTARTLELFRAVGISVPDTAHVGGPPRRARVESLAGNWQEEYPWSQPGSRPDIEYSPVHTTAIAQDHLEPILRDRAATLGADLRLGTELVAFTQDDEGVSATVRRRDTGAPYALRAQYMIAADGADSPVREALGIGRSGQGLLSVQSSILFRAPLDAYLESGVVQFEISQPGWDTFLTTYSDGRWVLMLPEDRDYSEDEQRRLIRRAVGDDDLPIELLTTGRWELAARIADRFNSGRVFLTGDAAHQLPPNRGGYGANTGIDDVHNLAWKLAAVLAGTSTPQLLDTYDAERRPIAWLRHEQIFARADYKAHLSGPVSDTPVIDDVAMELGQLYRSAAIDGAPADLPPAQRPDQWAGQPGTRAPHLWLHTDNGHTISTLDLFGATWTVLAEDHRWAPAVAEAVQEVGVPTTFELIDPAKVVGPQAFLDAYGLSRTGATLVRPDGYIAARWPTAPYDTAGALTETLAHVAAAARRPTEARP
ncbi:FAD-dependent monooxygenase [Mycobacterium lentiflavum]|uniref:FAD-dependent monooxygenase n=1 Tax=Mycobacterium lentiflavum TaxID=141349 RepID=A0ABY3UXA3_MYCLN|nr:FAD-dependent monooxygenase [Mycobacterium lentiflavum]ULP41610.1 FAD-dependent monooxygenase [Mycobacterium lentiflavum]